MLKIRSLVFGTLIVAVFSTASFGQVRYLPDDTCVFARWMAYAKNGSHDMTRLARFFMGTPYVAGTLEGDSIECLRINFRQLDCFTFVENVVAFRMNLQNDKPGFAGFCDALQRIRYRNGQIDGYLSRLHYTSEWLHDNQRKGILNLPTLAACEAFHPKVSFMSTHCDRYPALKVRPERCSAMAAIEKTVNSYTFGYIPKTKLTIQGEGIRDGDIIAITTRIPGLDIAHVGFALRSNGKLYLLHASSAKHKVVVSDEPLSDYLAKHKNHTGIIVARYL